MLRRYEKSPDNLYFFTLFFINRDLFTILRQRKRVTSRHRLKGNHSFCKNQIYSHLFHQSLLNAFELIAASFGAPARKVRIRLRPSTEMVCGTGNFTLHQKVTHLNTYQSRSGTNDLERCDISQTQSQRVALPLHGLRYLHSQAMGVRHCSDKHLYA